MNGVTNDGASLGDEARRWARPPGVVLEEHLAILKAVEDGREDDAERLMRAHVRATREELQKYLTAGDFTPSSLR